MKNYVIRDHNCIELLMYSAKPALKIREGFVSLSFLVQSFFETLQYCDEWRKFTSVSQSVSESVIV